MMDHEFQSKPAPNIFKFVEENLQDWVNRYDGILAVGIGGVTRREIQLYVQDPDSMINKLPRVFHNGDDTYNVIVLKHVKFSFT
jgi:hypothetical protein